MLPLEFITFSLPIRRELKVLLTRLSYNLHFPFSLFYSDLHHSVAKIKKTDNEYHILMRM